MKLIGSMFVIVLSGMGLSLFLGAPFFMCWNVLPFSLPEITWVQGSGMLFILWSTMLTIFFARAIGVLISAGASSVVKPNEPVVSQNESI